MPKLEPKAVQKELEKGRVWPVFYLYGPERMKSRELFRKIRKCVLGEKADEAGFSSFLEEVLDGGEVSADAIVDSARTLALGGGTRLVVVRDAHLIKDPEPIAELFGANAPLSETPAVTVLLAKELDGRRKFSKLLSEQAAVVECSEIAEQDRDAWIEYLAKRRGVELSANDAAFLRSLDPWGLEIVDHELEKIELGGHHEPDADGPVPVASARGSDVFFDAFFGRQEARALEMAASFADKPDEALPLLGLLSWNVRQLALTVADREKGTRSLKLSPFLADRFKRWSRGWSLAEVIRLQKRLQELDFSLKQTPRLPLALWGTLILEFCRPEGRQNS